LAETDPRQRGLFGAAWTVGYLAALAASGAEAIVLGTAVGPRGAIHRRLPEPQPWFDGSAGQRIYPLFHVIKAAAAASGQEVVDATSSAPRRVAALGWREGDATRILLANLTPDGQRVGLDGSSRAAASCRVLDETAFVAATAEPDWATQSGKMLGDHGIELPPYAVAFVTLGAG
jgi:hypothetical protein